MSHSPSDLDRPLASAPTDNSPAEADASPAEDLVEVLLRANNLEQSGEIDRARQLYRDIIAQDGDGVWGQSAQKALDELPPADDAADTADAAPQDAPELPSEPEPVAEAPKPAPAPTPAPAVKVSGLNLGTQLKLAVLATTLVPLAAVTGSLLWLTPESGVRGNLPVEAVEADRPAAGRPWLTLLVGGASAAVALALVLPWLDRSGQQIQAIARYGRAACRERAPSPLSLPARGDEVGIIAASVQQLNERLQAQGDRLGRIEQERDRDLQQSQQEKARLQQQALDLLERLEAARAGDLTVEAPLSEGEVGAIADAFNATTGSLRRFVAQTASGTNAVTGRAQDSAAAVRQLSESARHQSEELQATLETVTAIAQAIERLSRATQDAAELAHRASGSARDGDTDMDAAVASMDRLRTTVANTAKKAKRLAESAQEVSQILTVVSGISERANLLAFNAAIEAARAGERGEGFRQVADDVRGLAVQIGESAGDIERLVGGIQEETADVLDVLESGTAEVVNSTQSVNQTQRTLRQLNELSQAIERSLQDVARDSAERARDSGAVSQVVADVNQIALTNADEAQRVVSVLQGLLDDVEAIEVAMSQFQVE